MFQRWPKRDPNKHYYLVPNEVFNLGLSSHEIAVYNYLLRCEDRRTYQCHPSYRTIGRAVQLSENTVRKYVAGLEEKGLIRTEPSTITTKDVSMSKRSSSVRMIGVATLYGRFATRVNGSSPLNSGRSADVRASASLLMTVRRFLASCLLYTSPSPRDA